MDQKMLNLLATASAELNALGDDENSGMLMSAVEWLIVANGLPNEAFDEANKVFISMRDRSITDIPDTRCPDEAERCVAALLDGSAELTTGAKLLTDCAAFMKDYWAELTASRE